MKIRCRLAFLTAALLTVLYLLLFACTSCAIFNRAETLGGLEGLWVREGFGIKLSPDGGFEQGPWDDLTKTFKPFQSLYYLTKGNQITVYNVTEDNIQRENWSSFFSYRLKGDTLTAGSDLKWEKYAGDYTYDDSSKLAPPVDYDRVYTAFHAGKPDSDQTSDEQWSGVWEQQDGNGVAGFYAVLFRDGYAYIGIKGDSAEGIYNDSAGLRGVMGGADKFGAKYRLANDKVILSPPEGREGPTLEWRRSGGTFWIGDGVIKEERSGNLVSISMDGEYRKAN